MIHGITDQVGKCNRDGGFRAEHPHRTSRIYKSDVASILQHHRDVLGRDPAGQRSEIDLGEL